MSRTFFVTTVTHQRQTLFRNLARTNLLIETMLHYRQQGKYLLHEFVVMPDHLHLVLTPASELSLERAVQLIKGGFSFRLHVTWPVWQASFTNHRIRDDEDFARHCEYVRMNPVCARIVARAEEFVYSSASGKWEMDEPPGLKPLSQALVTRP